MLAQGKNKGPNLLQETIMENTGNNLTSKYFPGSIAEDLTSLFKKI